MVESLTGLSVTPLNPRFGVRVEADLSRPLTQELKNAIRALLYEHHVLVFDAPGLSSPMQQELIELFGTALPAQAGKPLEHIVSNVRADGYLGTYEIDWHVDGSFVPEPYLANSLYALELEPDRSSTRFAKATPDCLPGELIDKVRFLQVVNTNEIEQPRGRRLAALAPDIPGCAHRMISRHPVSGAEYIAANFYQTDCVLGTDLAAGQALLDQVYEHLYAPENIYEHSWRNGDLVIWDNLVVHHARGDITGAGPRTLRRFTSGTTEVAEQLSDTQREKLARAMDARVGKGASRRPMPEPA